MHLVIQFWRKSRLLNHKIPVSDTSWFYVTLKVKGVLLFCCVWELYMEELVYGHCLMHIWKNTIAGQRHS
jgi:hypothetical protein